MAINNLINARFFAIKKSVISLVALLLISALAAPPEASAKPTFSFSFPAGFSISKLVGGNNEVTHGGATGNARSSTGAKPYSGLRLANDSLIMIYWYDQLVAIVELGPRKLLLNCELIEVYDDDDRTLLLKQLSKMNRPLQISFRKMMKLMSQCQQVEGVERMVPRGRSLGSDSDQQRLARAGPRGLLDNSPLSLLSGIIPGTKWCGTGDIAVTYHDLGTERRMDSCCRTHDLCPVKVRAFSSRYNLTNNSIYSKSHCSCDDELFSCLKATNTSASQLMGNIYFNLVRVPCLEDMTSGRRFRSAKDGF